MKHKNVQVGQRVIVKRSTLEFLDTAKRHIGEEFTVGKVEDLDYPGEATVHLDNARGLGFWCNHRDIKLVKEQASSVPSSDEGAAPQVGDLFEVMGRTGAYHNFDTGALVRLGRLDNNDGIHGYENAEGAWQYVASSDLRALTKEDIWARTTAKPAAPKELSWPWPKGTRVRLSGIGKDKALLFDADPEAEYILGDDGDNIPPLLTLDGEHAFFVEERLVVLA